VVFTEDSAAAGQGIVLELPGLVMVWSVPDFVDTCLGCQFGEFSES
jgi:hypothetical protein